ncbi:MAG: alpha/beta fold hydrolase [Paracoccaceae bacterium]
MKPYHLDLNGHQTRVMTSGQTGPVLLFLHGFPEWSGAWEEIFAALPEMRCYAPDLRGYGISFRPAEVAAYATGKIARDVMDLIGVLDLDRVHLIGHDWGASVAYAAAFKQDPRIASLTVLNGVHPIPFQKALARGGAQTAASQYIPRLLRSGSEDKLAADGFVGLTQLFAEEMDMSWLTGRKLEAYRAAWGSAAGLGAMINWYRASPLVVRAPGARVAKDELPNFPAPEMRVTIPHLLIWGMNDTLLLPEAREGLDTLCDDLTVREIKDADHWLHHQKPGEVADLIRAFVQQHDQGNT